MSTYCPLIQKSKKHYFQKNKKHKKSESNFFHLDKKSSQKIQQPPKQPIKKKS